MLNHESDLALECPKWQSWLRQKNGLGRDLAAHDRHVASDLVQISLWRSQVDRYLVLEALLAFTEKDAAYLERIL